jgi:hypothetical protein
LPRGSCAQPSASPTAAPSTTSAAIEGEREGTFGDYSQWTGDAVVLYDDFDPQQRVARSAAEYATLWEPNFNALRSAGTGWSTDRRWSRPVIWLPPGWSSWPLRETLAGGVTRYLHHSFVGLEAGRGRLAHRTRALLHGRYSRRPGGFGRCGRRRMVT